MAKFLGKIIKADYGMVEGNTSEVGLQLTFAFDGKVVETGTALLSRINPFDSSASSVADELLDDTNSLISTLQKAKVDTVSALVGKPVEVVIEDGLYKGYRILFEVL